MFRAKKTAVKPLQSDALPAELLRVAEARLPTPIRTGDPQITIGWIETRTSRSLFEKTLGEGFSATSWRPDDSWLVDHVRSFVSQGHKKIPFPSDSPHATRHTQDATFIMLSIPEDDPLSLPNPPRNNSTNHSVAQKSNALRPRNLHSNVPSGAKSKKLEIYRDDSLPDDGNGVNALCPDPTKLAQRVGRTSSRRRRYASD